MSFENGELYLKYIEFKKHTILARTSFDYNYGEEINIKIIQNNNNYIIYINDEETFNINANTYSLSGGVGVFASKADAEFKSLKVNVNE